MCIRHRWESLLHLLAYRTVLKEFCKSNEKKQIQISQYDLNQINNFGYNVDLLKPLRNKWDMEISLTLHGFPEAEN
jgi:hypothetical protein